MKQVLSCIVLLTVISVNTQSKPPKGMFLCKEGSLEMSNGKKVSLPSFYISNEITNKQFREFYMHVKQYTAGFKKALFKFGQ